MLTQGFCRQGQDCTFAHTYEELAFGMQLAWRNSSKCIGRMQWKNLLVRDVRHIQHPDEIFEECIEQIDIGGPAMIRSAAKNHDAVVVVTDPSQYDRVIEALRRGDQVVTQGGLVGKVTKVKEGENEIEVEIAKGVNVRVIKSTVAQVMSKTEPAAG